uniref:ATP synthase complex subunit 8 n=1 Tax=Platydema sp. PLA01 TaxID=1205640 RepID=A0A0S2MRX4_9CUCU|nr:ATP synthase F0 subunit 8 [Platydema sp. PLA01]
MPQMAPLNWLSLMIMFILILVLFNVINYYSFNYSVNKKFTKIKKSQINWKW